MNIFFALKGSKLFIIICIEPGRKPRRPIFSQRGSYDILNVPMIDATNQSNQCCPCEAGEGVDSNTGRTEAESAADLSLNCTDRLFRS